MINLYTTHCPKCNILEKELKNKNIKYNVIEDIDTMIKKGFMQVPKLEINEKILDYNEAIEWIRTN